MLCRPAPPTQPHRGASSKRIPRASPLGEGFPLPGVHLMITQLNETCLSISSARNTQGYCVCFGENLNFESYGKC